MDYLEILSWKEQRCWVSKALVHRHLEIVDGEASLVCTISCGLFVLIEAPPTKLVRGAETVSLTLVIGLGCYIFDGHEYCPSFSPVHYHSVL